MENIEIKFILTAFNAFLLAKYLRFWGIRIDINGNVNFWKCPIVYTQCFDKFQVSMYLELRFLHIHTGE